MSNENPQNPSPAAMPPPSNDAGAQTMPQFYIPGAPPAYPSVPHVTTGGDTPVQPLTYAPNPPQMIFKCPPVFLDVPIQTDCPYCGDHIVTITKYVPGAMAWLMCLTICMFGWIFIIGACFCWVPFIVSIFLDVRHFCPSCNAIIGTYKRI